MHVSPPIAFSSVLRCKLVFAANSAGGTVAMAILAPGESWFKIPSLSAHPCYQETGRLVLGHP